MEIIMIYARRWGLFVLFLSCIFLSQIASAIITVDYSGKLGPNRMQKETNWCFAFAASDALSFALGYSPNQQISAADLAIQSHTANYAHLFQNLNALATQKGLAQAFVGAASSATKAQQNAGLIITDIGGYSIVDVAMTVKGEGFCFEKDFPGVSFSQSSETYLHYFQQKAGYSYLDFFKHFTLNKALSVKCNVDPNIIQSAQEMGPLVEIYGLCHINLSQDEITTLVEKKTQANQELKKSIGSICQRKAVTKDIKVVYTGRPPSAEETLALIRKFLSSYGPVLITIDSNYLKGAPLKGGSDHEVLIVSEKIENKKLSYKIRNPWPCDDLQQDLRTSCRNGEFWIDADSLVKITAELAVIL
jgi:hypothetical protein